MMHFRQPTFIISSFSTGPYLPVEQFEQEVDVENELAFESDMNEPGGQQPYRAVLAVVPEPRPLLSVLKAYLLPVTDNHAPPHNVRLNPLL